MDEENAWKQQVKLLSNLEESGNITDQDVSEILELSNQIAANAWFVGYDNGYKHGTVGE